MTLATWTTVVSMEEARRQKQGLSLRRSKIMLRQETSAVSLSKHTRTFIIKFTDAEASGVLWISLQHQVSTFLWRSRNVASPPCPCQRTSGCTCLEKCGIERNEARKGWKAARRASHLQTVLNSLNRVILPLSATALQQELHTRWLTRASERGPCGEK